MCLTTKDSLLAFSILIIISVLLYIRNDKYDRIISYLFVVISGIQLIEYLYHANIISSTTGGFMIFIDLWLQIAVLSIGIDWYFNTKLTRIIAIFFSIVLIIALIYSFNCEFEVTRASGHLEWFRQSSSSILGNFGLVYLAGLLIPFLVIEYYSDWKDIGSWILLGSIFGSALVVRYKYPSIVFPSLWCYSAVAIIFVAWIVGAFNEK